MLINTSTALFCIAAFCMRCDLAAQISGQGTVPAVTADLLTPVVVSASVGNSLPVSIQSLPPGRTAATGFSIEAVARDRSFAPLARAARRLSIASSRHSVMIESIESAENRSNTAGASSFSTLNETLILVMTEELDANLHIDFSRPTGPGLAFTMEVDIDNDGTVDFDGRASLNNVTLPMQRSAGSGRPLPILIRSSIQATARAAPGRSRLRMNLLPRLLTASVNGCVPGTTMFASPRIDSGFDVVILDTRAALSTLQHSVLLVGTRLSSPVQLPHAAATGCTLDVAPVFALNLPLQNRATNSVSFPGSVPRSLRPFEITVQNIGASPQSLPPTIHASAPLTLRFN